MDLMPVVDYCINNKTRYAAYNVTPDNSIDLFTIAELVNKRSGKNLPILVAHAGIGLEYSGDNARLKEEIQKIKFTPIIESIDYLYRWYEGNIHLVDRSKLVVDK
jgi:GDP-L-fucose synthase